MADLEHLIRIEARPEEIFPLVSTGDGFKAWWAEDVVHESNGLVRLSFFDGSTVYALRPLGHAAPKAAAWRCETGKEWAGTRLTFALRGADSATLLQFAHADWQAPTEYFRMCNTTWGELMYRLKATAEGHPHGPLFRKSAMAY
jgi:hypothetical protein